MFNKAFTFGRFNIPHLGHAQLFKVLRQLGSEVVVGVSMSGKNNPMGLRLKALRLLDDSVEYTVAATPFDLPITEDDVIILGQDQEHLANAVSDHFGCATFLVPRNASQPSSTLCRKYIDSGDYNSLLKLIPEESVEISIKLRNEEINS